MTKRYKKLQSKLHELECVLDKALLLDPETQSHDSISNEIKQKFAFIGNLLSAEVASNPSKPHHLHHISERLSTLEKEFHQWDSFRSFRCHDDSDRDSTCSCTESCLNDDGEALDDTDLVDFEKTEKVFLDSNCEKGIVEYSGHVEEEKHIGEMDNLDYEDADDFFKGFAEEKGIVEFDCALLGKSGEEGEKNNDLEGEERGESTIGKKCCCALASGVVIGMTLMGFIMVNIFGCFHYVTEQVSFDVPT